MGELFEGRGRGGLGVAKKGLVCQGNRPLMAATMLGDRSPNNDRDFSDDS